jgi:hypothetical protein
VVPAFSSFANGPRDGASTNLFGPFPSRVPTFSAVAVAPRDERQLGGAIPALARCASAFIEVLRGCSSEMVFTADPLPPTSVPRVLL